MTKPKRGKRLELYEKLVAEGRDAARKHGMLELRMERTLVIRLVDRWQEGMIAEKANMAPVVVEKEIKVPRDESPKAIHLHNFYWRGTAMLAGVIRAMSLCGLVNLTPGRQVTSHEEDATCRRCLAMAAARKEKAA